MSDVAAAAAALGIPEALVERSAEARAAETGATVDDILAAWAGGQASPPGDGDVASPADAGAVAVADATAASAGDADASEDADTTTAQPTESAGAVPQIVIETPEPVPAPERAPAGPYEPPVLVGAKDSPMTVLAGAIGLFLIVILVGLVGPSIPTDAAGARSSEIAYSGQALDGREVYVTAGCASCHSQMVRPVVADIGLGAVTLGDTNQVLGTRRFGPDLSDVGNRLTSAQIEATIDGLGGHPVQVLTDHDLGALVSYLSESRTSEREGAGS